MKTLPSWLISRSENMELGRGTYNWLSQSGSDQLWYTTVITINICKVQLLKLWSPSDSQGCKRWPWYSLAGKGPITPAPITGFSQNLAVCFSPILQQKHIALYPWDQVKCLLYINLNGRPREEVGLGQGHFGEKSFHRYFRPTEAPSIPNQSSPQRSQLFPKVYILRSQ